MRIRRCRLCRRQFIGQARHHLLVCEGLGPLAAAVWVVAVQVAVLAIWLS